MSRLMGVIGDGRARETKRNNVETIELNESRREYQADTS